MNGVLDEAEPARADRLGQHGAEPAETVQRRIAAMERDGLIKRVYRFSGKYKGQQANAYDFAGLIKEATPYAVEALEAREKRRKADAARRTENGCTWYRPMRTRGTSKCRRGSIGTKTRMAKLRLRR